MKRYQIKVLRRGDTVLSVQDFQIVVRRARGEVDIIRFSFDEHGLPRIDTDTMVTITFGDGSIEMSDSPSGKSSSHRETSDVSKKAAPSRRRKDNRETIVGTF